jgi:hypothetical protein
MYVLIADIIELKSLPASAYATAKLARVSAPPTLTSICSQFASVYRGWGNFTPIEHEIIHVKGEIYLFGPSLRGVICFRIQGGLMQSSMIGR